MNIELGAAVKTKDGQGAGKITKVIWDPAENQVREFVINTGGLLGHDVIVSRDVLERATPDGKELVVDLTKHELEGLDHFEEHAYVPPPYGFLTPAESKYASADLLFPLATAVTDARPGETSSGDTARAQGRHRLSIKKGMPVKDASGRALGVVDELRIDDMTGELRAIVLRDHGRAHADAHIDRTGQTGQTGKTREIPADHLDIGDGEVHVIEDVPEHLAGRDT